QVAAFIGAVPGALHLRTDVERKVLHGVELTQRLPLEAYLPEARDEVYRRIFKKAEVALDAGHSILVDAAFLESAKRNALRDLAQRTGATFSAFWLDADIELLRERLASRHGDASDADINALEKQLETVDAPDDWVRIDTTGTIAATANALLERLSTRS